MAARRVEGMRENRKCYELQRSLRLVCDQMRLYWLTNGRLGGAACTNSRRWGPRCNKILNHEKDS